jgi:hypothetical protein
MQVFTLSQISNVASFKIIFMVLLVFLVMNSVHAVKQVSPFSPKMAPVAEPFQTITLYLSKASRCVKKSEKLHHDKGIKTCLKKSTSRFVCLLVVH